MTYKISPETNYNNVTEQFETLLSVDNEPMSYYCSYNKEESRRRAVIAGMLMAIDELDNDCHCGHKTVLMHDEGDCPRCEKCNGKVYL